MQFTWSWHEWMTWCVVWALVLLIALWIKANRSYERPAPGSVILFLGLVVVCMCSIAIAGYVGVLPRFPPALSA